MKAALLTGYGGVDNLELRDVHEPKVGPTDIKVRVAGASINPIDWKLRSGAMKAWRPLEFPAILGRDASGTVVEVGPAVATFKPGARVLGLVQSAYAELVVSAADAWAEVPAKLDLVDAGALPLVLLTGAQLVEEGLNPRAKDVVLVTGAWERRPRGGLRGEGARRLRVGWGPAKAAGRSGEARCRRRRCAGRRRRDRKAAVARRCGRHRRGRDDSKSLGKGEVGRHDRERLG